MLFRSWHGVTSTTAPNLLIRDAASLAAMWAKWLGIGRTASLATAATSGLLCLAAAGLWLKRKEIARPAYLEVSLLLLLIPMLSPQGWDYVYLLGVPAVALVIDRFGGLSLPWKALAVVAIFFTCLLTFDTVVAQLVRFWAGSFDIRRSPNDTTVIDMIQYARLATDYVWLIGGWLR